jgi:DNA-binding transcriptional LysR family regulator
VYAGEFEKNGREMKVRVAGHLTFNSLVGLAYLPEDQAQMHIAGGRLIRVLADWCPPFSGYRLYYPSRRQYTPTFALALDALSRRRLQ